MKSGMQFMFKDKLTWDALVNMDMLEMTKQELLKLLKDNDKEIINGVNIAEILKGS